jgi:putative thioredoxin
MASYVDVTDATAEAQIIARSAEVPVVVDLWAPWCGPCRTLGPIIESVIEATNGEVELVKVNTDENPALTQMFQVQGIPAVHAVRDGRVVASFVGAQSESYVQAWVDKLRPTETERQIAALLAEGGEPALQQALTLAPDDAKVIVALAEVFVAEKRNDEALALLAKIPENAESRRVAALARTGVAAGDGISTDAGALADVEAKLDDLLATVRTDEDARQAYVDLLEVMGPEDPRTAEYRKKLTRALF